MKKLISFILALAMAACMSVTAFAADGPSGPSGSTTLTVNVPNKQFYTLNIPADQTITYGKTETNIGKVTVSDVDTTVSGVDVDCRWTNFTDGLNSIPLTIVFDSYLDGGRVNNHANPVLYAEYIYRATNERYCEYFAQVSASDWAAAVPGDYTATLTWTSTYTLK